MKKILITFVIVVVLGLGIWKVKSTETVPISGKPTIKIGALFAMTGNLQAVGERMEHALTKAVNEANKNKDNQFIYQIVLENDEGAPAKAAVGAKKLLSYDKVNVLMTGYSGPSLAVKPLAIENKTILFGNTYAATFPDGKYVFQNYPITPYFMPIIMDFIKENKAKNIALVLSQTTALPEIENILKPLLIKENISWTDYLYQTSETDFKMMVSKLKQSNHDMILMHGFMPAVILIPKELRQQNVNLPILGFDTLEVANNDASQLEGVYEVGKIWSAEKSDLLSDGVYVYDTINIIIDAFERAGKELNKIPTSDEFREYLYKTPTYKGIAGDIHLENTGQFRTKAYLKQVKNGQPIVITE